MVSKIRTGTHGFLIPNQGPLTSIPNSHPDLGNLISCRCLQFSANNLSTTFQLNTSILKVPQASNYGRKNHHIFLKLHNEQYLSVSSIKVHSLNCITLEEKEVNNDMLTDSSAVFSILTGLIESNDLIHSEKHFKIQTLLHINESLKVFCYTLNA